MAAGTIMKAYRGPAASLPTLEAGQLGFTTDTEIMYVGDGATNHAILMGSQATAAGLALLDDANAAAQIATLGLDADIATLSLPASTTITAAGAALIDDAAATNQITTLGFKSTAAAISTRLMGWKVFDDATAVTTGDGKVIFSVPPDLNGMNLVSVFASVSTVSSSGNPTVSIENLTDTTVMLSTLLTIDATEYDSSTATAAVIDTDHDDVATGDRLEINVDTAGTGTKGLFVVLGFSA